MRHETINPIYIDPYTHVINPLVQTQSIRKTIVCAICFENIACSYHLMCGHGYHFKCIEAWTKRSIYKTCPLCRKKIERNKNNGVCYIRVHSKALYIFDIIKNSSL